ncbi:MAG: CBS domain-containing protein [Firmicutes bacterium]|nr:CBS domain-containing protein [Bacillota bacterium]
MPGEHRVRDFMTTPALSIPVDSSLLEAVLLLRRSGIRHLPVVDGERLVGIFTERDMLRFSPSLLMKISPDEYNAIFETTPLEKVMTRDPVRVTPETPMRVAAALLQEKKIGCLPVVEGDRLVGIITVTDMLVALLQLLSPVPLARTP